MARQEQENVLVPLSTRTIDNFTFLIGGKREIEKLHQQNLSPIFVTKEMPPKLQHKLYTMTQGVLLGGGKDIHPSRYGQATHLSVTSTDKEQDDMEIGITQKTKEDGKPFIGLCRGGQILAVAHDGTLKQHLPDVTAENHGVSSGIETVFPSSVFHDIVIKPGTKARDIFQADQLLSIPSLHHQAIDNPGSLIVSGRSPKGVIEIVEDPNEIFRIGAQPHFELIDTTDVIFDAFAHAVRQWH